VADMRLMRSRLLLGALLTLTALPATASAAHAPKRPTAAQAQQAVKAQMRREDSSLLGGVINCRRLTAKRFGCTWTAQNVLGEYQACNGTARASRLTYGWDVDLKNLSTDEWCY
jgi:hypothetical protein